MEKVVLVKFSGTNKDYAYFTDEKFEPMDQAVVEVSGEYKVVTVVQVEGLSKSHHERANKWIVQKINKEKYEERRKKQIGELDNNYKQLTMETPDGRN